MILVVTYGPHASEHFRWSKFAPPRKIEIQSNCPKQRGLSGREIGVAIYERERRPSLPLSHIGYAYARFQKRNDPPFFRARMQE
ncbi:hypothetical protein GGP99_001767 [Salinibacter ruber]|uniref:Uncharacterized protein n=1 Tax=Salinibacter ruber TaxID=146919 RepID=A0AAW5P7E3_9BACT|nr:hypothetical protein [Salinibacter ruber]